VLDVRLTDCARKAHAAVRTVLERAFVSHPLLTALWTCPGN
jgi:hypothetical protein